MSCSSASSGDTSQPLPTALLRPTTSNIRPIRGHTRSSTRYTALSAPSGYATALLRSPARSRPLSVGPERGNWEDESLRRFRYSEPVNPLDLIESLQNCLAEQDFKQGEPDRFDSIYQNLRGHAPTPKRAMASSNAFPALDTSLPSAGNRAAGTSPTTTSSINGSNGFNGPASAAATAAYIPPLPVGHQQDLNHLFNQIQELGNLLRSNREKVNGITKNAEEVAKRVNGALTDGEAGAADNDKVRIRELELELAKQKHLVELYKHEQKENTNLIAMYEEAMGTVVEQIRNYCGDIEARFLKQRKHYNDLLQQEKDDHLKSRLDRDHWYAKTLKVCEMIRTAHRLRTDEWAEEYTIIAALQGEVRVLRRVIGMEPEKPEEETGWPYLKDLPLPE